MDIAEYNNDRFDLTELEKKACRVIGDVLEHSSFGDNEWSENEVAGVTDAGFYDTDLCETEDIPWDDRNQLGGILSSLEKKGVIVLEPDSLVEDLHIKVTRGRRKLVVKQRDRVLVWGIGSAVKALAD